VPPDRIELSTSPLPRNKLTLRNLSFFDFLPSTHQLCTTLPLHFRSSLLHEEFADAPLPDPRGKAAQKWLA
jgi:hypothetical protein